MLNLAKWWRSLEMLDRVSLIFSAAAMLWLGCVTLPTIFAHLLK